MKTYTVQCEYAHYWAHVNTIEAESVEDACEKAIELANNDSAWKSTDHCGETFVSAIVEDEDEGKLFGPDALDVPHVWSEAGNFGVDLSDLIRAARTVARLRDHAAHPVLQRALARLANALSEHDGPTTLLVPDNSPGAVVEVRLEPKDA